SLLSFGCFLFFYSSNSMANVRLLEFTVQCKIIEDSDKPFSAETAAAVAEEMTKALLDLRVRGESTAALTIKPRSRRNSELKNPPVSSASRTTTSGLYMSLDTIVSRVMFVYMDKEGVRHRKCTMETSQDCPLIEMLRANTAKADLPAQKCRVFSCDKQWGEVKEVDLHKKGTTSLLTFLTRRSSRVNFIVDYINTQSERKRPEAFDLSEVKLID
ncbi:hypothetical protein PFISCL1PPCAC_25121, partial [Pristionchus fissidentatus]